MRQRLGTRDRGFLSRGALLSLFVHGNLAAAFWIVVSIFAARDEARRAEEIDVAFEDVNAADLPADLPALDPASDPLPPPEKTPKLDRKRDKKMTPLAQKKPEPEIVVPPMPPMPEAAPPPPPPPDRSGHEKIVDLDNDKDIPPPPDAKYLAQKNNRAETETRATDTTLVKSKPVDKTSLPDAEKAHIGELEDQKSAAGRKAPEVTPHEKAEQAAAKPDTPPQRKSPLALRDPAPRTHELTPQTVDPSLPKAPDGDLAQQVHNARGTPADPAKEAAGKNVKLALTAKDYEYIFGADAEAERNLAQQQRSTRVGKFEQRRARVMAALENFIPEVRPGNTTALNTRAAPFAAYIARMHRSIHRLWGFGQLEDWSELPGASPFNKMHLLTTLEIVLNPDGTVDKISIVRTSGYLPYDAAAIDVAFTAGPYPDPPREIRSVNGKIYVHWTFHRDERQCTPAFTDYFIVDKPPQPAGPVDSEPVAAAPHAPHAPHAAMPQPIGAATGSPVPATPAAAGGPTANSGPRRLQRYENRNRAGMQRLDQEVAAAEEHDAAAASAAPSAAPQPHVAQATDPAARALAGQWFSALKAGDTDALGNLSALPFKTGGKEVAKRATLVAMLGDLVREGAGASLPSVQLVSAAGLRNMLGKLPSGLADAADQLYAVAALSSHDALILVLGQRAGVWRAVGLVRR